MFTFMQFLIMIILIGVCIIMNLTMVKKCPKQKVIYKKIVMHPLDIQFSEQNKPSNVFKDMFSKSNVTIGGYQLDSGRTVIKEKK